jgi:hypothetical protein
MKLKEAALLNETKKFNLVKSGDVGEDYGGGKGTVISKGKGKAGWNKFKRYDTGDIKHLIDSGDIDVNTLELVMVDNGYDDILYVYGPDGFEV